MAPVLIKGGNVTDRHSGSIPGGDKDGYQGRHSRGQSTGSSTHTKQTAKHQDPQSRMKHLTQGSVFPAVRNNPPTRLLVPRTKP